LPAGRAILRVRHLGHEALELEVLVPANREVGVDLVLGVRPVVLDPVNVDGGRVSPAEDSIPAPAAAVDRAAIRVLEAAPGLSEVGLASAARESVGEDPLDP